MQHRGEVEVISKTDGAGHISQTRITSIQLLREDALRLVNERPPPGGRAAYPQHGCTWVSADVSDIECGMLFPASASGHQNFRQTCIFVFVIQGSNEVVSISVSSWWLPAIGFRSREVAKSP